MLLNFFFFFQAEAGIRDYKVTGVQTCALPIWRRGALRGGRRSKALSSSPPWCATASWSGSAGMAIFTSIDEPYAGLLRSGPRPRLVPSVGARRRQRGAVIGRATCNVASRNGALGQMDRGGGRGHVHGAGRA